MLRKAILVNTSLSLEKEEKYVGLSWCYFSLMCTKYFIWRKEKQFTVRFSLSRCWRAFFHVLVWESSSAHSSASIGSTEIYECYSRESIVSSVNSDHGEIGSRRWLSAYRGGVRRTHSWLRRSDLSLCTSMASDSAAYECLEVHRSMATRTARRTGPTHSICWPKNSACLRSISRYKRSSSNKARDFIVSGPPQPYKCSHRAKYPGASLSRISSMALEPSRSFSKSQVSLIDRREDTALLSSSSSSRMNGSNHHLNISIDRLRSTPLSSPSYATRQDLFDLADYGRDFTYETLAYLPRSSPFVAMTVCEENTLIYAQDSSELVILPLHNPRQTISVALEKTSQIRDLCYVAWLSKCLMITDMEVYLLDYETTECTSIESGMDYITGAVDNVHSVFYLVKHSTLYKYDQSSYLHLQADQYPIADGYLSRKVSLDNKTNDYLALLVYNKKEQQNHVLVYATRSLADGYLYKIVIDDRIDRHWICSNGDEGWLIRGTHPGSCFDLNVQGLRSVRTFDSLEIRNLIPMNEHQRFLICTDAEIFVLMKYPFVQTFWTGDFVFQKNKENTSIPSRCSCTMVTPRTIARFNGTPSVILPCQPMCRWTWQRRSPCPTSRISMS